jgi:hypothetical protein
MCRLICRLYFTFGGILSGLGGNFAGRLGFRPEFSDRIFRGNADIDFLDALLRFAVKHHRQNNDGCDYQGN